MAILQQCHRAWMKLLFALCSVTLFHIIPQGLLQARANPALGDITIQEQRVNNNQLLQP